MAHTLQQQVLRRPFASMGPSSSQTRPVAPRRARLQCQAHSQSAPAEPTRRGLLAAAALATVTLSAQVQPARAFTPPPAGYSLHQDKLDGYSFFYPQDWTAVTSSGNDIFLRNPFVIEENLFVDISSPSSSRYQSVTDLGTPEDAAASLLDRYLNKEFMSTRIGIKREGQVVEASSRTGADGQTYYDIRVCMRMGAMRVLCHEK